MLKIQWDRSVGELEAENQKYKNENSNFIMKNIRIAFLRMCGSVWAATAAHADSLDASTLVVWN